MSQAIGWQLAAATNARSIAQTGIRNISRKARAIESVENATCSRSKLRKRMKDEGRRRQVVEYVRAGLAAQYVKPELLDAAVALFISQHKFGLKDGKVIAVGRRGTEEAELAAVNWIADEGAAYTTAASSEANTGGFATQVARLKKLH